MAHQNYQIDMRDADNAMDPHEFMESFVEASREENKRVEFDLKYSVPQILALIHKDDLGISPMEDLALSFSASSFQLLHQTITHLATRLGDSEKSMPQLWKDLVKIVISGSPIVTEEPAVEESLGPKLEELECVDVHEEQTQDLNTSHSHNFSTPTPVTNNSGNTITPPNSSVSPHTSPQQINRNNVAIGETDSRTINIPTIASAPPPQEDNKLSFTVLSVELLGALTNLVVSSRPTHNQVLIYVVVACSTLSLYISSTALVLNKKRPAVAKKMQEAALLIGMLGFTGIMGMLLPSAITWPFTVAAFLVYMLMFVVASLIK